MTTTTKYAAMNSATFAELIGGLLRNLGPAKNPPRDLRIQGWRPAGVRVTLDGELDCWLQADILSHGMSRTVTCCEAKDMP